MSRSVVPVSIIVSTALVGGLVGWFIAYFVVHDPFFQGLICLYAGIGGVWAGLFLGVVIARAVVKQNE